MKNLLITALLIAVFLIPAEATHAASSLKVTADTSKSSATVSWAKCKGASGYDVYLGKRHVSTAKTKATFTGLSQNNSYQVTVKAFAKKRVKQYFNSKTKKWVNKKPRLLSWKGKKIRYRYVKKTLASRTIKIKTKDGTISVTLMFSSAHGPARNVEGFLTREDGKSFYFTTDNNGCVKRNLLPGKYAVSIDDPVYSLPSKMKIAINSAAKTYVIHCAEAPAFLDVVVKSSVQEEASVVIEDENGETIREEEVTLTKGYNYPADAEVPVGEYTVTISKADNVDSQKVTVDECGGVFSAYFDYT